MSDCIALVIHIRTWVNHLDNFMIVRYLWASYMHRNSPVRIVAHSGYTLHSM